MKNSYSFLVLAVIFTFLSVEMLAQEKGGGDRVGGIRLGYHVSQFSDKGESFGDPMESFYIGLFRDNKVLSLLHFGTGLEYYKNGTKMVDYERDLYYLSIPMYLKLKLGPVFLLTGFSPSFKVAERIIEDGVSEKPTDEEKAEWFDIPFFVGGGVKISFVTLEVRYHWGLREVTDGYMTQSFQIGAGISF
jgi:hypothetical protein